jgi:hypothetical protein
VATQSSAHGTHRDKVGLAESPIPYTFLRNGTDTIGTVCGMPPGAETAPSARNVYFAVANVDAAEGA